ncbi:hypothetical protein ACFQ45_02760 [Rhodanobacter aciditrophus]|uniref:Uncharacterized protein n=1 Tax=Rhodanobacter aciditrophus TaxID=1623218 RepID=A0ABW4AZ48_9GAMM
MAKNADKVEQKDDTEQESKPKRKLPLGLIASFFGCFVLSVGASSGVTYMLVSSNTEDEISAEEETVDSQLVAMRQSIEQQNSAIDAMSAENETLKTYLRHSSATALKNILINQEENIQGYLSVMRQAIGDLGDILPNGTDWETTYQYQMDLAMKSSMERASLLRLLKTGEPPEQPNNVAPQTTTSTQ